jgi:heavy metal efflux system protein
MIQKLVDVALKNRFLDLGMAVMLFAWGAVSFYNLLVDACPEVADNHVNIITRRPRHFAEDIEKRITVPYENAIDRITDMKNLRSFSLSGISKA